MIKAGITGGIGSGKTTVCRIFELFGIPVYYADEESKKLLAGDAQVRNEVIEAFGKQVLDEQGRPDRKKLAELVFADKDKLAKLNNILHPAVGRHFEQWLLSKADAPYILKEAAVLFESGADKSLDTVITISAPEQLRLERTVARDRISAAEVKNRMKNQLSDKEREERADHRIQNDEQRLLIPQVIKIHEMLSADK